MAYAALVSLSQTVQKVLHDQDRYPISPRVKQQIISIHEQSILFEAFLENYPQEANSLEGRIRDAANEAEGTIEYFMWEQIDQRGNYTSKSTAGAESSEVSDLSGLRFDYKKLRKVVKEVESIAGEVKEIKNSSRTEDVQQLSDSSSVATSSSSRLTIGSTNSKLDVAMVGCEDELMGIKARLCGESPNLEVIPILGMGGIGKTTLAKNVYDDQLTVEHFQIRAWVTISQDYSAPQVLSSLLVSIGVRRSQESDESKMDEIVYKSLKGKRYLVVMDDMWSKKAWDDVRMILPDDRNGSRILLTTRLSDVATYPDSCSPLHEKRFMDPDQSWNLLQQRVFPQGNCPSELEDIGKTIARSCRGLPLAISVISGHLSTVSQTPASWEDIARNVNEVVSRNDEEFEETVLAWSYNHLPHHLRPCFLYMGFFPEDYEIHVSKLIKLWIAEGFLKLSNGSKSWEEVAEEYLEDLVKRSLVLVTRKKSTGKIKSCSIHDMVRDLCIRKAQQEKFLVHVKDNWPRLESMKVQRRVSIDRPADLHFVKYIFGSHIRTIICNGWENSGPDEYLWDSLQNIRLLRAFDIVEKVMEFNFTFEWFGSSLRFLREIKLFHLRYLTLPYDLEIPESISNLNHLCTIPGTTASKVTIFSWNLLQLRHLVTQSHFDGLPDPEAACFPLENLQTLSQVNNFKCTQKILRMIPNIKKLGICYLKGVNVRDVELENLKYLDQLEKLKLRIAWGLINTGRRIVFPTTLKKLTLSGLQRTWEEMSIIGSLPNLEVLKLQNDACFGYTWETSEGEFLRLKFLLIDGSGLQHWITESSHFPSLKCLVLHYCPFLKQIPDGIGEILTLELIGVGYRDKYLLASAKRIQEEQRDWGNDTLQVRRFNWENRKLRLEEGMDEGTEED